jgi:transcriptional regulator with XRE-family HTH domain
MLEDHNIKIGNRLKQIRNSKNLTLREVAKEIRIDHSYLAKMEKGNLPSISILFSLAEYYNVDINYLLTGKEESEVLKKWEPVISLFEERGIKPEEIMLLQSLLNKMFSK